MASKNRLYPHLLPPDIALWERFLAGRGELYDHFEYDLRVGEGRPADTTLPPRLQQMAMDLSQKRIDAIGYRTDTIEIIEITTYAGMTSLGQLLSYPELFYLLRLPDKPIIRVLVAEKLAPDMEMLFQHHGVTVFLYPPGAELQTAP